jgi:hypothetical protein
MTKSKFKITEVNCTTGEEIVRDATAEELNQMEVDKITGEAQQAEAEAKETAKAAILDRIGLTADELKTILG